MSIFDESTLENAIIELLEQEGYKHILGSDIHKEKEEILLIEDLKLYLTSKYPLTENEVKAIINEIRVKERLPLYESNKEIMKMIEKGIIFKRENKNEKDLYIEFIDRKEITRNIIKIVNQLEIKGENTRIPDGIIYINGLPLVVFEFKSAVKENTTIKNAYEQLTIRYKRDIEDLFKYNAFVVISDGVNNKYGSVFSKYEYFYSWKDIDNKDDGIRSLYSMIHGLFKKEILLDVINNFIFFPDSSKKEVKIICRYPQYFATKKLHKNIKEHIKPIGDGKGGTYFGATGCGKSYTMLFLTRLLMKDIELASPTIILITDRMDLDEQLSSQFLEAKNYIGDAGIQRIESRENLKEVLNNRKSGGVFLTTIQKFTESISLLSERENIICISDEAHRSQVNMEQSLKITDKGVKKSYGFAKYLHDSLPNATYVGFTGTPIDATLDVFGKVVESYTMSESVKDGITVNIVYEGRASNVVMDNAKIKEIEEYYKKCFEEGTNEYQIEESKKAVTRLDVIIGDDDRIRAVAEDFIKHYENRVKEKATVKGKAMFVCMDRKIAYKLYKKIIEIRPEWAESKLTDEDNVILSEKEKRELKAIPKVNLVMTKDKDDEKDLYNLLDKENKRELDRQFKNEKSNFKIAIVVDMWITGFDVPCLDTMYIDKPIQEHTLIQTISRVNRVYPGKEKGLVVDYFGIKRNMNDALKRFNKQDSEIFEEIGESVKIFKDQLDILERIFMRFDYSTFFNGTPVEKLECLNKATEYVQITNDIEKRFMNCVQKLKSAFNLCSYSEQISPVEKDKMYFFCAVRSVLFKLNKGTAPDIAQMNEKVKQMIQDAISSDGVEELFKEENQAIGRTVDIFNEEYISKINKIPQKNTKIKMLQRLLKMLIEDYSKVNKVKSYEFSERLQMLIDKYNSRKNDKTFSSDVLENVIEELNKLFEDINEDRDSFKKMGIDYEEKAFFDILFAISKKLNFEYPEGKMIKLAKEIKVIVDDKTRYTDCFKKEDVKAELKVDLILLLDKYNYPPVTNDEVYKKVFEQAENFKKYNM